MSEPVAHFHAYSKYEQARSEAETKLKELASTYELSFDMSEAVKRLLQEIEAEKECEL